MTPPVAADDVVRFRDAIARSLGLHFDDAKFGFLASVLERRVHAHGHDLGGYLERVVARALQSNELRELVSELTVPETYFFRHFDQFRAFVDVALPNRLAARATRRQLRLLSAGCASGEEPYSLAILLREGNLDPSWNVTIDAVDANRVVLEKAMRGRYSAWSLRETSAERRQRWFAREGAEFALGREAQSMVTFEESNLAHEGAERWRSGDYDVVFCRNVLMYFTPASAEALVRRLTSALAPGGYLFLGHAETLRGLSHDFHLRHTHGTFYYQRRDELGRAPVEGLASTPLLCAVQTPVFDPTWTSSWVEAVQGASDRIRTLSEGAGSAATRPAGERQRPDLHPTLDLLEQERFIEALGLLRDVRSPSGGDADAMLLRAALLTHSGDLDLAEVACAELLAFDELNAGAHYLVALCREGSGDAQGAAEQDRIAIYLDPTFAMAHLHLGLMARRSGDREAAHRELGQAIVLLQREDAPRLLLFGGGFRRDGLISLCRAELGRLGGEP